jgi:hypothetical protein
MHLASISSNIRRCNRRCPHPHQLVSQIAVRVSAGAVRCKGLDTFATRHSAGGARAGDKVAQTVSAAKRPPAPELAFPT